MAYQESDFNLCKACYVTLKHPSKKAIKKVVLTTYKDQCEHCRKVDRLVDCTWEPDEENED